MDRPETVGRADQTPARAAAISPTAGSPPRCSSPCRSGRPILLEGEVGVGKTEVAKVLASVFGRRLIRLQCYEGIDTNQALYEWDYARQMLQIRALSERQLDDDAAVDKLFGPKFLLERPLLEAVRAGDRAVLLIDEIDRADDEFEAFLLELLSDFQITIPEIGTIKAETPPLVVLTSNRTRELHDALKRRCLYHWVGYPSAEREVEIVLVRAPGRLRGAGPQGGRRGEPAARPRPGQAAGRRRDDRLGAHARGARRDRPRRPDGRRHPRRGREGARRPRAGPRATWTRSPPVPDEAPFVRAARRLRRASCARPGLAVGSGDVLTYCAAMAAARPDRPARPLLGRTHDDGHPARADPGLRPGVPPVLPRRGRRAAEPLRLSRPGARPRRSRCCRCPPPSPAAKAARSRGPARPGRLRRRGPAEQVVRARAPPEELAALRRIMARMRLDPAAPPHPAHAPRARRRPRPGPAPDGARDDAHARRAGRAVLAPAPAAAAAADPDPRRLRLDGRLLAQPAAVRLLGQARRPPGSRCSASAPGSPGSPGRCERRRADDAMEQAAKAVVRLGGRHPDRRLAGHVRARLGPARRCAGAGSW